MKILFLVSRYAPHGIGGAERVSQTLARSLSDRGHEIVVLTTAQPGDQPERVIDGIRVRCVPLRNVYDLGHPTNGLVKSLWHLIDSWNPWMKEDVARVLREEAPDVMHSHLVTGFSPTAWDAAAEIGVPIVHTLHDHYVICARSSMALHGVACNKRHLRCAILSPPRVRAAGRVDAVVAVSQYVLDRHRAFGAFLDVPAHIIGNPCHLVGADRSGRTKRDLTGGPLRLGFLGRIERNKGIDLLLAATRSLPADGWTLAVAGSGEPALTDQLQSQYESPRVAFVGRVDPSTFLSQTDVLVVPSTFPETFGMSAAEALAMGVPVVASGIGALPELVRDGKNGFVFDPMTPGALERLLARIVSNPSVLEPLSGRSRETVNDLAPASIAARYDEVYQSVTARRRTAR